MGWETLRDFIDSRLAAAVAGYTGAIRTALKSGLITSVARGIEDEGISGTPSVPAVNGISTSVTILPTADQVSVTTNVPASTITVGLTTTQPAGDYAMRSDGAGGVSWVPFSAGTSYVEVPYMFYLVDVIETAATDFIVSPVVSPI